MDLNRSSHGANELFRAQSHIYKHAFSYANSFCLNCALQLGIPDIIHNHNRPMSHPELVSALQLPPEKSSPLHRVMSLLVHLGFFSTTKIDSNQEEEEEEGYALTPSSRLLLRDEITNLSPFARAMVDPVLVNPWRSLGDWFLGKEQSQLTPFETAFGVGMWEYCDRNPEFNNVFNGAMASDSRMMSLAVKDCKEVFEGLECNESMVLSMENTSTGCKQKGNEEKEEKKCKASMESFSSSKGNVWGKKKITDTCEGGDQQVLSVQPLISGNERLSFNQQPSQSQPSKYSR